MIIVRVEWLDKRMKEKDEIVHGAVVDVDVRPFFLLRFFTLCLRSAGSRFVVRKLFVFFVEVSSKLLATNIVQLLAYLF